MNRAVVIGLVLVLAGVLLAAGRSETSAGSDPDRAPGYAAEPVQPVDAASWAPKADFPGTAVYRAMGAEGHNGAGQRIYYVMGGQSEGGVCQDAAYAYNVITGTWSALASMPGVCANVGAAWWSDPGTGSDSSCIIIIGRYSPTYAKTCYRWTRATNTWDTIPQFPGSGQYVTGSMCGVIGDSLFAMIRQAATGNVALYRYSIREGAWDSLPRAAPPVATNYYGAACVFGGKLYQLGGWQSSKSFQVYRPGANTWTVLSPPTYDVGGNGSGLAAIPGTRFIMNWGGGNGWIPWTTNHVAVFDTASGAWSLDTSHVPVNALGLSNGVATIDSAGQYGVHFATGYTTTPQTFHYRGRYFVPPPPDTNWQYGPFSNFGLTRFDGEYFPGTSKVYFMGGRRANDSTDGRVFSFDVATRTYAATGATLPTPVSNYEITLLQDNYDLPAGDTWGLYIYGGRVSNGAYTNAVQAYYPRSNRTVAVTSDPYPNNTGGTFYIPASGVVYENQAIIPGGFQNSAQPYISNAVWKFDPLAGPGSRWTQMGNLALGRGYIQAAIVDSFLYACGGDTFDGTNLLPRAQVQRLNLNNPGAWTLVAPMPLPSDQARAFGFDAGTEYYRLTPGDLDRKIIIAGHGNWPNEDSLSFIYDAAANTWGSFPRLRRARRNHAAALIPGGDGRNGVPGIWIWGGRHTSDLIIGDTTEYYGLQTMSTGIAEKPALRLRHDLRVVPNPFRGMATVSYSLTTDGPHGLRLYDVTGALRLVLVDGRSGPGRHSVPLRATGSGPGRLTPGIYLLRLITEDGVDTGKLIIE